MKKLLLGLLLLLALTACDGQITPEPPESEGVMCVLTEPVPPDRDGLHIFVEREVYAPSLTTCTYFIYNHTDETVEFGEDYRIQRLAEQVNKALMIDAYCRIDFIMADDDKTIYCLEANTLPGMTPTSLVPQEAAAAGLDYGKLCEAIIQKSLEARKEGL